LIFMAEITGMYIAIQNHLIEEHKVILCDGMIDGCQCEYHRRSAHRCAYHKGDRNRKIRNWKQENTVKSTFILLHEIGHLQKHYEYRVEDEYRATEWALHKFRELHIHPDRDMITDKQIAITRLYDEYASKFHGFDLFGIEKPEWLKDREYYSIVRLYDQIFGGVKVN